MFKIKSTVVSRLEALGSSYRLSAQAGTGKFMAELVDRHTGKVWAKALGPDEPTAIENAVNTADLGAKPKTPAEMAQENASLKARIAELEGKRTSAPAVQPNRTGGGEGESASNPPKNGYDEFSPTELVQALKVQGLNVPEGDKRTGEWREEAINLLTAADATE